MQKGGVRGVDTWGGGTGRPRGGMSIHRGMGGQVYVGVLSSERGAGRGDTHTV